MGTNDLHAIERVRQPCRYPSGIVLVASDPDDRRPRPADERTQRPGGLDLAHSVGEFGAQMEGCGFEVVPDRPGDRGEVAPAQELAEGVEADVVIA
jgi:hypothetical protein